MSPNTLRRAPTIWIKPSPVGTHWMIALPKSFLTGSIPYHIRCIIVRLAPRTSYGQNWDLSPRTFADLRSWGIFRSFSSLFHTHTHTPTRVHFIIILWPKLLSVRGGPPSWRHYCQFLSLSLLRSLNNISRVNQSTKLGSPSHLNVGHPRIWLPMEKQRPRRNKIKEKEKKTRVEQSIPPCTGVPHPKADLGIVSCGSRTCRRAWSLFFFLEKYLVYLCSNGNWT